MGSDAYVSNVGIVSDDEPSLSGLWPNSPEYIFWDTFFSFTNHTQHTEFRRRAETSPRSVNWDFFNGIHSYSAALRGVADLARSWFFDREDHRELHGLAENVLRYRGQALNPNTTSYNRHDHVYRLWEDITRQFEGSHQDL